MVQLGSSKCWICNRDLRVVGVHSDLVFCGITDQTLGVGESDIGGCCAVTLVIGNDLNTIILPNTDTARCI